MEAVILNNERDTFFARWLRYCILLARATYQAFEIYCRPAKGADRSTAAGIRINDVRVQPPVEHQPGRFNGWRDYGYYTTNDPVIVEAIERALRRSESLYERYYFRTGMDRERGLEYCLNRRGEVVTAHQGMAKTVQSIPIHARIKGV